MDTRQQQHLQQRQRPQSERAGNLEIGKPTMDPKGARLAFYARSRIVNSSPPLSFYFSLSLSPSLSPPSLAAFSGSACNYVEPDRHRLAADFGFWPRCVWHKAKALKDNTFLTPTNKVVCVCGQHEMKEESQPDH